MFQADKQRKPAAKAITPTFERLEERMLLSLIGVNIDLPVMSYGVWGSLDFLPNWDGTPGGTFVAGAAPIRIVFPDGDSAFIEQFRNIDFRVALDDNGVVSGDPIGSDLMLDGVIDTPMGKHFDGRLIEAEVLEFGFLDSGTTDQYDFRLMPTGGDLYPYYAGGEIGIRMTSPNSSFTGDFTTYFMGECQGVLGALIPPAPPTSSLAGRVYVDADNDGADDGEAGVADVTVTLSGTDIYDRDVLLATLTDADGTYLFEDVQPGTYQIAQTQPAGLLDGLDSAGSLGGTAGNDVITGIVLAGGEEATGYNFGELEAASIAGSVIIDADNDGAADAGETGLADVTVTLTGTDDLGAAIDASVLTGVDGSFSFAGLRPGTYALAEGPTAGLLDGKDSAPLGGGIVGNDVISDIVLASGDVATGYTFGEVEAASLTGLVYVDLNGDGVGDGVTEGLEGVTVTLTGTDDLGNAVEASALTDANGGFGFSDLRPGTYALGETQPEYFLDGDDLAGDAGGVVVDDVIGEIALASGTNASGYQFGEIEPASLSGMVWIDFNNDGELDFDEEALPDVTVNLTGVDDRGNAVNLSTQTDAEGDYVFKSLRPGTYTVTETQPAEFADGQDILGTEGGTLANDQVTGIALAAGVDAMDYSFGERPEAGEAVARGQTAKVSFWWSCKGRRLIKSLNGGSSATQLGHWLAATYPHMYGAEAGDNNLAGLTNAEIVKIYKQTYAKKKCGRRWWARTVKVATLDSQVMALAFATYVTNESLAGTVAERYRFTVTEYGVGIATFNVGDAGEAFGVADDTEMTVLDILQATNAQTVDGILYDGDKVMRATAEAVYTAINEAGQRKFGSCCELKEWFAKRLCALLKQFLCKF